jgi:hypothetical protein
MHLRGRALWLGGDGAAARRVFQDGIEVSEKQEAKLFQLRNTASMAELLSQTGAAADARESLASLLAWFTEGLDTLVIRRARGILERL